MIYFLTPGRRNFLKTSLALGSASVLARALAQNKPRINPPALFENIPGGYHVLPSGGVFSGAAIAMAGYEIVHALMRPWMPLKESWGFIEAYLKGLGRPVQALCGMELRIPQQLSADAFRTFNGPYVEQLQKWDLLLGRYSAVCRTNVAPARDIPKEPSVHAFSYCVPSSHNATTFCVSGAADIDARGRPVAEGDTSPAGMKKRLTHCVEVITGRLEEIELDWSAVTHTDLCVVQDIPGLWDSVIAPGLQPATRHGVRVHLARPPIVGSEVELECRGVRQEITLSGG